MADGRGLKPNVVYVDYKIVLRSVMVFVNFVKFLKCLSVSVAQEL